MEILWQNSEQCFSFLFLFICRFDPQNYDQGRCIRYCKLSREHSFFVKDVFLVLGDDDVPTMEPSPSVYCQTIARNIISGVLHTLCSAHQPLYLQRGEVFINCRQIQPSSGLPVAGNHFAVGIFRQPCCKSNSRLKSPDKKFANLMNTKHKALKQSNCKDKELPALWSENTKYWLHLQESICC